MKTKTTYPENAKKAKAILVAGLIFIQAALIAGDSSDVKKEFTNTNDAYIAGTEVPNALKAENAYYYLNDVAFEAEMEIEEWMYNVHNDYMKSASEEEVELEEWMYNTQHSFWFDLNDAEESELAIERWMTNPNDWKNNSDELMLTSK